MDARKLRDLLKIAVERGIVDTDSLDGVDDSTVIESSEVPTSHLSLIYTRRLKHTGGDKVLLTRTEKLVDFLHSYPHEKLRTVWVYPKSGYIRVYLTDSEETEILHWMRMLDRKVAS